MASRIRGGPVNVPPVAAVRLSCLHVVQKLPGQPPTRHSFVNRVSVHVMPAKLPLVSCVPTFKGSDCTYRFCALRAPHTTRSRDPARHRSAGDRAEHHTHARPLDHLTETWS